jgi:hypothetical protein
MFDPNQLENAKGFVLDVNNDFNKEINPLLSKWARSKWAGAIAVGFGVALMAIGGVLSLVLVC